MFGRKRSYSENEVSSIVEAAVTKALAEQRTSGTQALATTVENLFARQLESFGKNTEAMSNFLAAMGDLGVRRAAIALGSRGGRKRAENAAARKQPQREESTCEVCRDPSSTNNAAIIRHVQEGHDARRRAAGIDADRKRELMDEHARFIAANGGRTN